MTRAINDPGNEDPGSLLETDADALLGGAAAQAPEEHCRLAAQGCIRACERYLALCIESGGEQRQHAGDCADLCRLATLLLERRSRGRRPPASWRRAMPWHARSVAMATSRWSANVRVPAGASSKPVGRCCRPEAGHFLPSWS
ncbi:hypothetical protein P4238_24285 [Pseudomonas aeruginosa]|nr:hypothetical protein [Pseudomonas aeruginosa]